MPELTVSMPAYNTGEYIGEAIESILRQDGVDFRLPTDEDLVKAIFDKAKASTRILTFEEIMTIVRDKCPDAVGKL